MCCVDVQPLWGILIPCASKQTATILGLSLLFNFDFLQPLTPGGAPCGVLDGYTTSTQEAPGKFSAIHARILTEHIKLDIDQQTDTKKTCMRLLYMYKGMYIFMPS